ncbi:hypothetical protein MTO96_037182 [Rhipicephalus appendiculatus]
MGKRDMADLIKKTANPTDLGIPDATMKEGGQGIILTTASKESTGKLESHIRIRPEFHQLKVNKPKENRFNIKIIGVDEDMADDALPQRLQSRTTSNVPLMIS